MTDDHTYRGDDVHSVELAERENNGGWQSIETAPKDGTWILGFGDGPSTVRYLYVMAWSIGNGWLEIYSDATMRPTHWMPRPAAPTEGE
jgi:hypothetical protein